MGSLRVEDITRDKVNELVVEANQQRKNRKAHVRKRLIEEFPGLENVSIVRNGHVYKALDYLDEGLDSYGK